MYKAKLRRLGYSCVYGVGKSIKLMNVVNNFCMTKTLNTIVSSMAIFAILASAFVAPISNATTTVEFNEFEFEKKIEFDGTPDYFEIPDDVDSTESGEVVIEKESVETKCELLASRYSVTTGGSLKLNWNTSGFDSIKINGETVSGDSGSKTIENLQETTAFILKAVNDAGAECLQTVVVTCEPPEEMVKRCEDYGYDFEIAKFEWDGKWRLESEPRDGYSVSATGNAASVNWTSNPAVKGVIAKAATVSELFSGGTSGEISKNQVGTGKHDLSHISLCGNEEVEEPNKCELKVEKEVDKATANPGDIITYTIDVANIGTADCTGGGVRILDVLSSQLSFVSYETSENIDGGYGSKPVYEESNRTLWFNGHELTPGEWGRVTVKAKVKEVEQCGEFTIENQAKATAKELDSFKIWSYSNVVKTNVKKNCDVPQAPVCPLETKDGRTIVTFEGLKLRSDQGESKAFTASQNVAFAAGEYDITLVSWDGYTDRVNTTAQPNEQWKLEFLSGDAVVGQSGVIVDLADYVIEDTKVEKVNEGYVLANAATAIRAAHAFYPDTTSANSLYPICAAIDEVPEEPVPTCDMFTANPSAIMVGASTTLTWETTNATDVFINNGVGSVAADGSVTVAPLADIVYKLTAVGADNKTVDCEVPVTVSEDEVPVCEYFTASPNNFAFGGGNVTLNWGVTGAQTVSITPTVGSVSESGTTSVNVTESTTFVLTAEDNNGDEVSCQAPVVVGDPVPFTCGDNVSFTVSDNSIRRGANVTLDWNVTGADSVSISGINATSFTGSQTVSPSSDVTYVLTATKNNNSIECPVSVDVSSGGGGGGSASPRCELTISDKKIKLGEEITLEWDTARATEVTLTDDRGNVLFTTDDYLSSDKEDYYDGSITVKPTRDTKYTLVAERGSRDRECNVEVEVENDVVVLETRDQQPLVAGISLSQVPYTGFEAGPFLTLMFYALLVAWALYVTYLIVARNRLDAPVVENAMSTNVAAMKQAEQTRPDLFAAASAGMAATAKAAPVNLPTGDVTIGYENENPHQVDDAEVTKIENRAHSQKALLSSDAIRHFVSTTAGEVEREESLDSVISEAKKMYPLEDGWIVINEARMRNLCEACQVNEAASDTVPYIPATVPEGTGSLAEAIVTGNVVAAYDMIGNRPMFALADAAADLDAVYRKRRGNDVAVSDLLIAETKDLSDEKIKNMITALTGALDGTYNDEASAVKMAIMKAVKEVA